MAVNVTITGVNELQRKFDLIKNAVDGPQARALAKRAAQPIAQQAKRNARRGPTGLLQAGISVLSGRKASRFGAVAIAKAKWKGTGAVFEEWGTQDRGPGDKKAMRVPAGKFGTASVVGNQGMRRGVKAWTANAFGFLYIKFARGMKGTRFFENAVDQKLPESSEILKQGLIDAISAATK